MLELSEKFEGATCEIKSENNVLLCIGTVALITEDAVEIVGYKDDELCVVPVNSQIKFSARNRSAFCVAEGVAYISGKSRLVLKDVKSINDTERRAFFRVPTDGLTGKLYEFTPDGKAVVTESVQDVLIVNISLTGLLFEPVNKEAKFRWDVVYLVELNLGGVPADFNIVLKRIENGEDMEHIKYGCMLPEMSEKKKDILCNYIFTKERELIKAKRRA